MTTLTEITEFTFIDPTRVDLVGSPAQGVEFLMLKAAATAERGSFGLSVIKASPEKRFTLGVAYAADHPDVTKAKDGFRDFASAAVVEKACHNFSKNGRRIGADHRDGTEGAGEVVENFIYRGPAWPQANGYTVKSGDWLIGVVWGADQWRTIKSGQRRGLSMQGATRRRRPSAAALARLR